MINLPSAVVLSVVSAISCTALVNLSSDALSVRNSTAGHSSLQSAVSAVFTEHGAPGTVGAEVCLPDACGAIAEIVEQDGTRTVTAKATDDDGRTLTRTRGYTKTTASHLTGTDAAGNPVWASEARANTYTWQAGK